MIITLDGPVASGKTTVGKMLAKKLGFDYLYSGFLYRAVGHVLVEYKKCTVEELSTISIASVQEVLETVNIAYSFLPNGNFSVTINNNVMAEIDLMYSIIDTAASIVGSNMSVRTIVTEMQRRLVIGRNVIVDGRDAGSVAFPEADYKFFLTASLAVRVQRYVKRQQKQGNTYTVEQAKSFITKRDKRDEHLLEISKNTAGVVIIDTSFMNQEEVVSKMIQQLSVKK